MAQIGLTLERDSGVRLNTQQLGANVIRALGDRAEVDDAVCGSNGAHSDQDSAELPLESKELGFGIDSGLETLRPRASVNTAENLQVLERAQYGDFEIVRYENLAIGVLRFGTLQNINVKGFLRPIANELGLPLFDRFGTPLNTRQLGAEVIRALNLKAS